MPEDTPSNETDSIARQDVLDSAGGSGRERRGVLRGTAAAVGAALGLAGGSAASDLTSMIGTAEASGDVGTQETFCTYQCIDGTCGCRKYYIDHTFGTCYDYDEWCCTGCTGCDESCPYS